MASSLFTSSITETIPIPGTASSTVTIRKLAPKHLAEASKAAQREALSLVSEVGGFEALKALAPSPPASDEPPKPAADPLVLFDRATLLRRGIVAWDLAPTLTPELIEDLDEPTQVFLARAILQLAQPALFQTEAAAAAARKNG